MGWNGRQHKPGIRFELLIASGRKYQRQLGQGRPAYSDARSREQRAGQAAATRRHECGGECRPRTRPRISHFHSRSLWGRRLNMADASVNAPRPINRPAITLCVILAVIMQALDTTIANVALPYMQGSVSASADQINWVLTSYIVAAAIMTAPSGFLATRFGRKRVLMVAVVGFVIASVLCGIAQSLVQIVAFRLLQGFFGAALVPLGQSVLLDIYTVEERGSAMAVFGVSVMVGPVLGPVIGGWLTDHYSWRWVFYINVPLGVLAFVGISFFLGETKTSAVAKLDWLGFGSLSVAIAAMQVFLDRGAQLDWFSSFEILIEAAVCASALYIFLVHTFTARNSFVNPRLFLDRNFSVGVLFIFIVGITYLASLALLTPYLQTLMGYPVVTAGIVM